MLGCSGEPASETALPSETATFNIHNDKWTMTVPAKGWTVKDVTDHPELVKIGENNSVGGFFISEKRAAGVTLNEVESFYKNLYKERKFTYVKVKSGDMALRAEGIQPSDDGSKSLKAVDFILVNDGVIYGLAGVAEQLPELEKIFMSFTFTK